MALGGNGKSSIGKIAASVDKYRSSGLPTKGEKKSARVTKREENQRTLQLIEKDNKEGNKNNDRKKVTFNEKKVDEENRASVKLAPHF